MQKNKSLLWWEARPDHTASTKADSLRSQEHKREWVPGQEANPNVLTTELEQLDSHSGNQRSVVSKSLPANQPQQSSRRPSPLQVSHCAISWREPGETFSGDFE